MLQIKLNLASFTFPETKRNIPGFSLLHCQCFKFCSWSRQNLSYLGLGSS